MPLLTVRTKKHNFGTDVYVGKVEVASIIRMKPKVYRAMHNDLEGKICFSDFRTKKEAIKHVKSLLGC